MAGDEIRNECASDRGAFSTMTFNRCARGFTLSASNTYDKMNGPHFAFDKIEDVAAWLVEQYGPPPKAAPALTAKRNTRSGRRPARRR